jgi:hypothetical protein
MRKITNTLGPSLKGFQSLKFSDSDFREVRGLGTSKKRASLVVRIQTTLGTLCPLDHESSTQLLRSNIPQTALVASLDTYDFN